MKFIEIYENYGSYETIIIAGLPGSGKSTLAKKLKVENPLKDYFIVEDGEYNESANMFGKNNIILCDGYIVDQQYFDAIIRDFKKKKLAFKLYLFENNPIKCVENIKSRHNHAMNANTLISEINYYSRTLEHIENECRLLVLSNLCKDIIEIPVWQN